MKIKSTVLMSTLVALSATTVSFAQRVDTVGELMRYERLSAQDAATVYALARGLGMSTREVISQKKSIGKATWVAGPAISIADKLNRDARYVWDLHNRGLSWEDIERNRYNDRYNDRNDDRYNDRTERRRHGDHWDYYDGKNWRCSNDRYNDDDWRSDDRLERRRHGDHWDYYDGRTWRCSNDRWNDDDQRIQRGGLEDVVGGILDDVLGRKSQGYDPNRGDYRNDRRYRDSEYERRMWHDNFLRAYMVNVDGIWRYVGNGMNVDDVAIASHLARVSRSRIEDVANEFLRSRNWNRVRDQFGVRSDWDTYDSRNRYNGRYRDRY